jgi:UDP-N-acetylglucosamine 4,6-dehydratase/5-epimerase
MKKKILITGGTGFLGINLAKKFSKKYTVILSGRNNKLNYIAKNKTKCEVIPLDVSNINSIRDAINYAKPDIIIHAAATKFVDLSEKFPFETIDSNVLGSSNIARVSIDKKIKTVIGISTDKASPPVKNIYGLSKSIMERLFLSSSNQSNTQFTCVRYGNVAWSTGSVLPIWKRMFDKNKTILTTGPYMRRFFFLVSDAVTLVDTALKNIKFLNGKILSREMKSAQMIDIIKTWINIYGGKYSIIGSRSGDRQDEYLIGEEELKYTIEKKINNIKHYVIDFSKTNKNSIKQIISSSNAEKLSNLDISKILKFGMKNEEE